jgi:hypothetical protein
LLCPCGAFAQWHAAGISGFKNRLGCGKKYLWRSALLDNAVSSVHYGFSDLSVVFEAFGKAESA